MAKKIKYAQCKLRKEVENKYYKVTTAWIPEKYAVINKTLRIRNTDTGEWEDGWVVTHSFQVLDSPHLSFPRTLDGYWR